MNSFSKISNWFVIVPFLINQIFSHWFHTPSVSKPWLNNSTSHSFPLSFKIAILRPQFSTNQRTARRYLSSSGVVAFLFTGDEELAALANGIFPFFHSGDYELTALVGGVFPLSAPATRSFQQCVFLFSSSASSTTKHGTFII